MLFVPTSIPDAYVIRAETHEDERGSFARTFSRDAFEAHGLNPHIEQCCISTNRKRGTLRGLHFQVPPRCEAKLVRCLRGAVFDVVLDLRPDSVAFGEWEGFEIDGVRGTGVYVPEGCAHGFLTLEDDTEIAYQISEAYDPALGRGIRYDCPTLGIDWPMTPTVVSERDRTWPGFDPEAVRRLLGGRRTESV